MSKHNEVHPRLYLLVAPVKAITLRQVMEAIKRTEALLKRRDHRDGGHTGTRVPLTSANSVIVTLDRAGRLLAFRGRTC